MIYNVEVYYRNVHAGLDGDVLSERLSRDRVTMAVMLASGDRAKTGVSFGDFIALVRLAEEYNCLSVYVDFYGRPVSYVIVGRSLPLCSNEQPEVGFGVSSTHGYLVDFVIREGSLDDTISLWLSERSETVLIVHRRNRPKQFRSYSLCRMRKFQWRTATYSDRFAVKKGVGLRQFEERSKSVLENYQTVQMVLEILASDGGCSTDITLSVPLIYDLLALGQVAISRAGGICSAISIIALADINAWVERNNGCVLHLPLRDFVSGSDIIVTELQGEVGDLANLRASVLCQFAAEGENRAYICGRSPSGECTNSLYVGGWHEAVVQPKRKDVVLVEMNRAKS